MRVVRNLAGVLVGLCIAATATGSTPMRVEVRSGALELSLAVSRTAFRVGEEIPLVFSLRNVSEAAAFIQSFPPRFFDFSVYAADGALVRKPTFVGRPIMAPPIGRMLRPGETITATITWQPWMLDPTGRRVRVLPGSYSIEAYALWDRSGTPLLRSARLSIEIRPERSGAADHLQSREDRGQISAGTFPALLHVGLCYRGALIASPIHPGGARG